MQFQVTTIEAQTMNVGNTAFNITTYEQKTTAFCDCCENTATGTKEDLRRRGWQFGKGCEFCPECN